MAEMTLEINFAQFPNPNRRGGRMIRHRYFKLAVLRDDTGISCDEHGVFVGPIALLTRADIKSCDGVWMPRNTSKISADLSASYAIPVDIRPKLGGLNAIARALNQANIVLAKIATLHLQLPDLPRRRVLAKYDENIEELVTLLKLTGIYKGDWDSAKHPRWPTGQSDGGQFRPADASASGPTAAEENYRPSSDLSTQPSTQTAENDNVSTGDSSEGGSVSTSSSMPQTANVDRYQICLESCSKLLERPKPYRSWDVNKYDFHKCMTECLSGRG